MNRNGYILVIGALIVVIAVGGYFFYQERHKSGIEVEVGKGGISVQTN